MKTCEIAQAEIRCQPIRDLVIPVKPRDLILWNEASNFRNVLQKVIGRLTTDFALRQDLMQECLIHLWRMQHKGEHLSQTSSWYLQNCQFHAQHLLCAGRSLDSIKRASEARRVVIDSGSNEPLTEVLHTNGELFEAVSAQDIVLTLQRHLRPRESALLKCLADGWMLREISIKLGLSYPTALKYRRRIAELTIKLGIAAPQPYRKRHPRRVSRVNGRQARHRHGKVHGAHQVESLNHRDGEMKS